MLPCAQPEFYARKTTTCFRLYIIYLFSTEGRHTGDRWEVYSAQMKRSSKAVLLSGLIFPGIGHMFLKHYQRGSVLMLLALVSFSIIVTRAYDRALTIVDRIISGDVAAESGAIAEAVSTANTGSDSLIESASMIVLLVCWLLGIVDSYRLGSAQEKQES